MKLSVAAALSLAASEASAHYIFQQVGAGTSVNPVWKYIRKHTNYNSPVTDLTSKDLVCNVGASADGVETLSVAAGSQVTFKTDTAVYHQGPTSVYLSKADGSLSSYDGSGGWFKIKDWGATFPGGEWTLSDTYTFTIPSCIPSGDYLLRIQQIGIHNPWPAGVPQFYLSCAHISVTGGGSASPATVSIPGAFKETDPGYTVNIYSNFNNYTVPGPEVFTCSGSGSGSGSGSTPSSQPTTSILPTSTVVATTLKTSTVVATTKSSSTSSASSGSQPTTPSGCTVAKYGQCGGIGYSGCTSCASGSTCKVGNDYYSQCL
ncbi:glycosyl hydrolase family 61-domain-containing protein [Neurospora hispaniola]|uniref:lytic cellulose monooxygenase (C4-dehydrogenating) n=1 Tax=Neurospora hispaniola TaxID=588809 RepID=A0AAJ0ICV3_9PEZI|nr:glycosyl hydrolase family 61-domain-containing protein [Neurospora hispaniola]